MRRILPVASDLRPEVYRKLLVEAYDRMVAGTREVQTKDS